MVAGGASGTLDDALSVFLLDREDSVPTWFATMLLAGAVFVAGAVGIEMIEGSLRSAESGDAWLEHATDVQELFEMGAIVLLVDGLLRALEGATVATLFGATRSTSGDGGASDTPAVPDGSGDPEPLERVTSPAES